MEGQNPNDGHQRQSEEEAVIRDAAAEDGVPQHALALQEEEVAAVEEDGGEWAPWVEAGGGPAVEEDGGEWAPWDTGLRGGVEGGPAVEAGWPVAEGGADGLLDLDLDATAQDEAMAHALYMDELMQVQDWDLRRFELDEPRPAGAGAVEPQAVAVHNAPPAGQAGGVPHQLAAGLLVFDGSSAADMQELADHNAAVENPQFVGAQVWRGSGGGHSNQTARHGHRPVGGGESMTIRLETRRSSADAVISARQVVLGDARSPAVLAGMEEGEHDGNNWYDSVLHEAQRMEQIEEADPAGLYEVSFHTKLPSPAQQEPTDEPGFDPSDLVPDDEPGPSTVARVPPLGDDEMPHFTCGICMETLPILDLFHGMQCDHKFCVECMATYIEGRVNAGEVPVPCPDPTCKDGDGEGGRRLALHPEECKKSIDFAAFGSWGDRLTESAIPQSRRAYCPNPQCGVMLEATGGKTPAMAFCPACAHPMCASCGLDWSQDDSGRHDCAEGASATLVKKLVEERRWKQCPKCKMVVERTYGCDVMRCRCLFVFCYACGLPTGRQTGMDEGAELCQCHNTAHAGQMHPEWHEHQ